MLSFFHHLRFRHQIFALMLAFVATTVLLPMLVAMPYVFSAHRKLTFDRLESIAMTKAGWLSEMLARMSKDALAASVNDMTIESTRELSEILSRLQETNSDNSALYDLRKALEKQVRAQEGVGRVSRPGGTAELREYEAVRRRIRRMFRVGRMEEDYVDTLIIEAKSQLILYSNVNDKDILTNLKDERFASSSIKSIFQLITEREERGRSFRPGGSENRSTPDGRSLRGAGQGPLPQGDRATTRPLPRGDGATTRPLFRARLSEAPRLDGAARNFRFRGQGANSTLPLGVRFGDFDLATSDQGQPLACIGAVIVDRGQNAGSGPPELLGVLINRFSVEPLDKIMLQREGLGETGETYLVGPDQLMRSDSWRLEEPSAMSQKVNTMATREALAGRKGFGIIKNYKGKEVFSVWLPFDVFGKTWALVAEQETSDAYEILYANLKHMAKIGAFLTILLTIMAYWFSRQIDRPIGLLLKRARALAANKDIPDAKESVSGREISELVAGFNEMARKIKERDAMKDEFLHIASHDLKNPLSVVLGASGVICNNFPPGSVQTENSYTMVERIYSRAQEMEWIITDFLDFQAMEDGQLKIELLPLDLSLLAKEVVEKNKLYAQEKEIDLSFETPETVPEAQGDPARIQQVAMNLVGNAIKFSPQEGSVIVRLLAEDHAILFEVSDTGPGLDDEDMGNLFKKYARLKNKPTSGEKSSGLGLAICKELIDLHTGQIGARNNTGSGTTFWFRLPQKGSYGP